MERRPVCCILQRQEAWRPCAWGHSWGFLRWRKHRRTTAKTSLCCVSHSENESRSSKPPSSSSAAVRERNRESSESENGAPKLQSLREPSRGGRLVGRDQSNDTVCVCCERETKIWTALCLLVVLRLQRTFLGFAGFIYRTWTQRNFVSRIDNFLDTVRKKDGQSWLPWCRRKKYYACCYFSFSLIFYLFNFL